jgi:DNA-binding response OmpR family regulator
MTILVVDDDAGLRRALKRVLVSNGFEVEVADGGANALARLRAETFDLVVLDVMMPDADGIEVCARVDSSPSRSRIAGHRGVSRCPSYPADGNRNVLFSMSDRGR